MNIHQESAGLLLAAPPILHKCNLPTIRQHEAANIERIAKRMLRELRACLIVHTATRIGAHGINLYDFLPKTRLSGWLNNIGQPLVKFGDHGAIKCGGGVEGDGAALKRGDFKRTR